MNRADMPLVSIIIRSMDRLTLTETLASVASQTYPNVEVIVVNARGGKHGLLSSSCGRFPLRLINNHGEPLARSAAANFGLDAASGDFIAFLDDDDLILSEHLAQLATVLEEHSEFCATYCGVKCIDEYGGPLPDYFGKPYSKLRLMSGNFIPIHSVLFRARIQEKGCRFDEALDLFEDWDFWLQLAENGPFFYLPSVTALYRISSSGGFGVKCGDAEKSREATRRLVAKWQTKWPSDSVYALMETGRYYHMMADILQEKSADASPGSLIESLKLLIKTNHDLHQRLESVESQLDAVLRSRSWRLTAPYRYLVQAWRKRFTAPTKSL